MQAKTPEEETELRPGLQSLMADARFFALLPWGMAVLVGTAMTIVFCLGKHWAIAAFEALLTSGCVLAFLRVLWEPMPSIGGEKKGCGKCEPDCPGGQCPDCPNNP